jgi:hypothetical protein
MKYLVVLFLAVTNVWAQPQPRPGQHDLAFTALPVYPVKRVQWIVTDRVDELCQGFAPLSHGRKYIACTKFNDSVCIVYTRPNLTLSELGHEMRHCFEGHWHD